VFEEERLMNLSLYEQHLVEAGLARVYRGRLIPIMRGGDGRDEPLFPVVPDDLTVASVEDLDALATSIQDTLTEVAQAASDGDLSAYVTDEFGPTALVDAATEARTALTAIRAELAAREEDPTPDDGDGDPEPEGDDEDETAAALADTLAALAADDPEPDEAPVAEVVEAVEEPEPAQLAAAAAPPTLVASNPGPANVALTPARPARAPAARPVAASVPRVSLVASTGQFPGVDMGGTIDPITLGDMMIKQHHLFGERPTGSEQKFPLARANWADLYPSERRLGADAIANQSLIAAATDEKEIAAEMQRRRKSLTAAGGWCAPATPYYDLQSYGTAARPVRDSLPGFNAVRGGISHTTAPSLAGITDAIGIVTADDDAAGGTFAAKSCQVPDCPDFTTVLANAVYHCLQWGNMTARAYPELVAVWNDNTLTALARLAETYLLTRIGSLSTAVTAAQENGAINTVIPKLVAAAAGMRSRHRMDPNRVLRAMLPAWAAPFLVTDVIKSQFQRFDTDEARLTALLRSFNIEPTWYLDGATGAGQVFGAQSAGALLGFPTSLVAYLFPEGTFIHIDAGTLELGMVRDSVLNASNDFQTFGEFFENVARVGVESLKITFTVCNSGVVSAPAAAAAC